MTRPDTDIPSARRVVLIGGGYTGTALAIHLMRAAEAPLMLTVIDPSDRLGRGIAYGATDPEHRINVPSDRMSLFGDDPNHATRWLHENGILPDAGSTDEQGHHYVARANYGSYVEAMLADAIVASAPRVAFVHERARATGIAAEGPGWSVFLTDGRTVAADTVMLCFGHAPPALPCRVAAAARQARGFVENPWAPDAYGAIGQDDDVLIVGTGLTMADAVASLTRRKHRGSVTAISRRGLLPQAHGAFTEGVDVLDGQPPPRTARALLRLVRARIAARGPVEDWHPTVDALRAKLPEMWAILPDGEKRKVVRRLLPFWEVHRFRIAPQIHALIAAARREERLAIEAAALAGLDHDGSRFRATLRRGSGALEQRSFDAVVLCTGPNKNPSRHPVVATLLDGGLAQLDTIGMGIRVDTDFRVVDPAGRPHPGLLAIGPTVRGSFGEMTGAPDITRHIERITPMIAGGVASGGSPKGR